MTWAHLQTQFFTEHSPDREFFDRHLGAFPWNEQVLPVYEWGGLLYVAAVDPASISRMLSEWPQNWVLLQSEAQALKGLWTAWNPDEGVVPASNPFDSEPRSMSFQPENLPPAPVFEDAATDDVGEIDDSTQPRIPNPFVNEETAAPFEIPPLPSDDTASGKTPTVASVKTQIPAPVSASRRDDQTPPPAIPLPSVAEKKPVAAKTQKASSVPGEFNPDEFLGQVSAQAEKSAQTKEAEPGKSPGQFDLSDGFPEIDKTKTRSGSELEGTKTSSHQEHDSEDSQNEIPEGLDVPTSLREVAKGSGKSSSADDAFHELMGIQEQKAKKAPSAASPQADVAAVAKKASELRPQTLPTPKKAPPQSPQSLPETPQPPAHQEAPPAVLSLSASVKALLAQPPQGYSLLLVAVKAGNSLRVVGWPESHAAEKNLAQLEADFSLATPSPFRICLRTEKPYHGYLINSPFLDQFMKSWNEGKYPETLTVVPLIADHHVSGFVIAFGDASVATKSGLVAIERLTQDLIHKLPQTSQKKAS